MAMDVLSDIKAAEQKALETRRAAQAAAKEALKQAAQQNAQLEDEEITKARRAAIEKVNAGREAAKADLDAQQSGRLKECEALKQNARKRLEKAADLCLERILN